MRGTTGTWWSRSRTATRCRWRRRASSRSSSHTSASRTPGGRSSTSPGTDARGRWCRRALAPDGRTMMVSLATLMLVVSLNAAGQAQLDSAGVPAARVSPAAKRAVDTFIHAHERLLGASGEVRLPLTEDPKTRTYFINDFNWEIGRASCRERV